ncbi:unnamed protein product, partial [Taenia asiatica]|uniref:DDE Tnp4 domain-containing protein n=1 Tax=Taenia asiatica TaxID=60517 RepID=A0A0R3W0L0_TAEAS
VSEGLSNLTSKERRRQSVTTRRSQDVERRYYAKRAPVTLHKLFVKLNACVTMFPTLHQQTDEVKICRDRKAFIEFHEFRPMLFAVCNVAANRSVL